LLSAPLDSFFVLQKAKEDQSNVRPEFISFVPPKSEVTRSKATNRNIYDVAFSSIGSPGFTDLVDDLLNTLLSNVDHGDSTSFISEQVGRSTSLARCGA
jgi:hypothetical protein